MVGFQRVLQNEMKTLGGSLRVTGESEFYLPALG